MRDKRTWVPEAVSVQQTADILDVSVLTIRRWITRGFIKAYRVGPTLIRIPRSEVIRMRGERIRAVGGRPEYTVV